MSLNPFYYKGRNSRGVRGKYDAIDHLAYVGRTYVPKRSADKAFTSVYLEAEAFPELLDYKLPSRQPCDELYVLRELCSFLRSETDEGLVALSAANEVIKQLTPASARPAWFRDGIPRVDDCLDAIRDQNRAKHPGFPGCLMASTKGGVIDRYYVELIQAIYVRMICLLIVAPYCATGWDFYSTYCADPVSFSIKSEVVKFEKFGRGLCANSLVTSCVERLLYQPFSDMFKDFRYEAYSAIGIGFTRADSELLHLSSPSPSMKSDVPKFDSSETLDENLFCVDVVINSYRIDPTCSAAHMMRSLERAFAYKVLVLSNGHMYEQDIPGYQSTGRDMTSGFNTINRARRSFAVDVLVSHRDPSFESNTLCAGDDCNEEPHPDKGELYLDLGFPLRDVEVSELMSFCSHDWPDGRSPIGQRIFKSFFKMYLNLPLDYPRFVSFCKEYSSHPAFPALLKSVSERRPEMNEILEEMFQRSNLDSLELVDEESTTVSVIDQSRDTKPDYAPFARSRKKKQSQSAATPKRVVRNVVAKIRGRGDYTLSDADYSAYLDSKAELEKLRSRAKQSDAFKDNMRTGARAVGASLGALTPFGATAGTMLGDSAGTLLARLFGHGDFKLRGNSLMQGLPDSASMVPVFGEKGKRGVRIMEREYIGDVTAAGALVSGATAFSVASYAINPQNPKLFPWLSKFANLFDQWEPNGIVLEYVSTSSEFNGSSQALGSVVCATDYNSLDTTYANKQQMEEADYANSVKSSECLMHGIECAPSERLSKVLFTGPVEPNDAQNLYNLGNFQIATQGMSVSGVTVGELWVSYDITFYKKQMNSPGAQVPYFTASATNANGNSFSVVTPAACRGTLPVVLSGNNVTFPSYVTNGVFIVIVHFTAASGSPTGSLAAVTNCTLGNGGNYPLYTIESYSTTDCVAIGTFVVTGPNAVFAVTTTTAGASPGLYIQVVQAPSSLPYTNNIGA